MHSALIPTRKRSRGLVLTEEALQLLDQALKQQWEATSAKELSVTGRIKKLSRQEKGKLLELDANTVDKIYHHEPVDESTLRIAFGILKITPRFTKERYCVSVETPVGNLLCPSTNCIGRDKDVTTLLAMLEPARMVTLTGIGGIGKTRLALQVGAELQNRTPAGVWLVELAGVSDPSRVPQEIAAALGLAEQKGRSPLQVLSNLLRGKPTTLILDNCEHLLHACATLAQHLLSACPDLKIIATSRERLNIPFERSYRVPSLSVPDVKRLKGEDCAEILLRYDAARLLVERITTHRPDFIVTNRNAATIAAICRRLDGIPLALELAAARVCAMSLEELEQGLNRCFHILTGGNRAALPRHQTLRATLDWSYNLLDAKEQMLLRRLSIFADGWQREAAERVCGGNEIETREVGALLASLVEKNLVTYQEHEGTSRYRLLETARQYGRERLTESGETEEVAVKQRYRDYFLALAESANMHWNSEKENVWLQRLDAENENLRAALNECLEAEEAQTAQRFCGALDRFWQIQGYFTEGRMWCARALKTAGGQERTAERAEALRCASHLAVRQGDASLAETLCEESLAIWQERKDARGIALARMSLGTAIFGLRRCAEARNLMEDSLATFRVLGDKPGILWALYNLALVAREQDDYRTVSLRLEENLAIRRELGDRRGIASSLYALGENSRKRGDYTTARRLCGESLPIFRELGDRPGLAAALNQQGDLFMILGNYGAAAQPYQESLELYRELGFPHNVAWMLRNMGRLAFAQCRYDAAHESLAEALATFPPNNELGVALSLIDLGDVVREQGDLDRAGELFEQSAAILQTLEGRPCAALSRNRLGMVDLEQGRLQAARTRFETALTISQESGDKTGIAESGYNLGLVELERGDYDTARARFEEALAWFQTARTKQRTAHALRALGIVDCKQGDFASAETRHRQSLRLFREMGNQKDISRSLEAFAELAVAEGQWERAAQLWGAAERIRDALGAPPTPPEQKAQACTVQEARARAGRAAFAIAWEQGGNLNLEQAMAFALRSTL